MLTFRIQGAYIIRLIVIVFAILFLTISQAKETEKISPWTDKAYPEVLVNPNIRMKFGFDSQVSTRTSSLFVKYFDWDKIEEYLKEKSDGTWEEVMPLVSKDYIRSIEVLDQIKSDFPEIAANLTEGLNLREKQEIIKEEPPKLEIDSNGLILNNTNATEELAPKQESQLILPNRPQLQNQGLISPNLQDINQFGSKSTLTNANDDRANDWKLLNNRWNLLPKERKAQVIKASLLEPKQQVALALRASLSLGIAYGLNGSFLKDFTKNLPEEMQNLSLGVDMGEFEWRYDGTQSEATTFLDELAYFYKTANIFHWIKHPEKAQTQDYDFHLHMSIEEEDRKEDLSQIADAWNDLILFTRLNQNDVNWARGSHVSYDTSVTAKGALRLLSPYHLEIRDQIFGPEETMTHFANLVHLNGDEAVDYIYKLLPKISDTHLKEIIIKKPQIWNALLKKKKLHKFFPDGFETKFQDPIFKYLVEKIETGDNKFNFSTLSFLSYEQFEILMQKYYKKSGHDKMAIDFSLSLDTTMPVNYFESLEKHLIKYLAKFPTDEKIGILLGFADTLFNINASFFEKTLSSEEIKVFIINLLEQFQNGDSAKFLWHLIMLSPENNDFFIEHYQSQTFDKKQNLIFVSLSYFGLKEYRFIKKVLTPTEYETIHRRLANKIPTMSYSRPRSTSLLLLTNNEFRRKFFEISDSIQRKTLYNLVFYIHVLSKQSLEPNEISALKEIEYFLIYKFEEISFDEEEKKLFLQPLKEWKPHDPHFKSFLEENGIKQPKGLSCRNALSFVSD